MNNAMNDNKVIDLQRRELPLKQESKREEEQATAEFQPISPIMRHPQAMELPKLREQRSEYVADTQSLNQFTTDFGAWNSPFTEETYRLEKLIRESDQTAYKEHQLAETNRTNIHTQEQRFDGESGYYHRTERLEKQDPIPTYEHRPLLEGPYTRTRGPQDFSWFKIFSSVTAAIATGAIFGYIVLTMFGNSSSITAINPLDVIGNGQSNISPSQAVNTAEDTTSIADDDMAQQTFDPKKTTAVDLSAKTYYVLQNGVFSTLDSANIAEDELKKKGLAAASEAGDKYTVFVGMSEDKEQAKLMKQSLINQQLIDSDIEVYVKPYEVPAATRILWNSAKSDVVSQYFAQSDKLVKFMVNWSQTQLINSSLTPLTSEDISTLQSQHQAWTKLIPEVETGLSEEATKLKQQMNSAMNNAVLSMEQYKKNPDKAYLWQAQSALMEFIVAEKELLTTIAVQ
jgi:stage II sporulation protein B